MSPTIKKIKKGTRRVSKNAEETQKIAKIFLEKILQEVAKDKNPGALVVELSGDLGAGKTTFVQAVAKHLGIKNKVNSPTFVIIKKYPIKKYAKKIKYKYLVHLDAYRLKNEKELLSLGWEEIINNQEHLVFIEWPENVAKIMPANTKSIQIAHLKDKYRSLKLQ